MPKPVCVPCQRFFRPKKNGFGWIEGMPIDNDTAPGTEQPENWRPYKVWMSDLWECQGCGSQIVVGHGGQPLAEHYQPEFERVVSDHDARLQVNDC